jgi:hypothetical protein
MPHQHEFLDTIGSRGAASRRPPPWRPGSGRGRAGACGRNQPDGKALCESRWQRVPAAPKEALFRARHRRQREPSNPEKREQYRLTLSPLHRRGRKDDLMGGNVRRSRRATGLTERVHSSLMRRCGRPFGGRGRSDHDASGLSTGSGPDRGDLGSRRLSAAPKVDGQPSAKGAAS